MAALSFNLQHCREKHHWLTGIFGLRLPACLSAWKRTLLQTSREARSFRYIGTEMARGFLSQTHNYWKAPSSSLQFPIPLKAKHLGRAPIKYMHLLALSFPFGGTVWGQGASSLLLQSYTYLSRTKPSCTPWDFSLTQHMSMECWFWDPGSNLRHWASMAMPRVDNSLNIWRHSSIFHDVRSLLTSHQDRACCL